MAGITEQALSGRADFYDDPTPHEMKTSGLLRLESGRPHTIEVHEDTVLLVTILGPAAAEKDIRAAN